MSDILLCGAALAVPLVWWWRRLDAWMAEIDRWTQGRDQ
jgi:hypothetical protein